MQLLENEQSVELNSYYQVLKDRLLNEVFPDEINDAGVSFVNFHRCPALEVEIDIGEMQPVYGSPFGTRLFMYEEAKISSKAEVLNKIFSCPLPAGVAFINKSKDGGFNVRNTRNNFCVYSPSWNKALIQAQKLIALQIIGYVPYEPIKWNI